jgi:hypothetical protein
MLFLFLILPNCKPIISVCIVNSSLWQKARGAGRFAMTSHGNSAIKALIRRLLMMSNRSAPSNLYPPDYVTNAMSVFRSEQRFLLV